MRKHGPASTTGDLDPRRHYGNLRFRLRRCQAASQAARVDGAVRSYKGEWSGDPWFLDVRALTIPGRSNRSNQTSDSSLAAHLRVGFPHVTLPGLLGHRSYLTPCSGGPSMRTSPALLLRYDLDGSVIESSSAASCRLSLRCGERRRRDTNRDTNWRLLDVLQVADGGDSATPVA